MPRALPTILINHDGIQTSAQKRPDSTPWLAANRDQGVTRAMIYRDGGGTEDTLHTLTARTLPLDNHDE